MSSTEGGDSARDHEFYEGLPSDAQQVLFPEGRANFAWLEALRNNKTNAIITLLCSGELNEGQYAWLFEKGLFARLSFSHRLEMEAVDMALTNLLFPIKANLTIQAFRDSPHGARMDLVVPALHRLVGLSTDQEKLARNCYGFFYGELYTMLRNVYGPTAHRELPFRALIEHADAYPHIVGACAAVGKQWTCPSHERIQFELRLLEIAKRSVPGALEIVPVFELEINVAFPHATPPERAQSEASIRALVDGVMEIIGAHWQQLRVVEAARKLLLRLIHHRHMYRAAVERLHELNAAERFARLMSVWNTHTQSEYEFLLTLLMSLLPESSTRSYIISGTALATIKSAIDAQLGKYPYLRFYLNIHECLQAGFPIHTTAWTEAARCRSQHGLCTQAMLLAVGTQVARWSLLPIQVRVSVLAYCSGNDNDTDRNAPHYVREVNTLAVVLAWRDALPPVNTPITSESPEAILLTGILSLLTSRVNVMRAHALQMPALRRVMNAELRAARALMVEVLRGRLDDPVLLGAGLEVLECDSSIPGIAQLLEDIVCNPLLMSSSEISPRVPDMLADARDTALADSIVLAVGRRRAERGVFQHFCEIVVAVCRTLRGLHYRDVFVSILETIDSLADLEPTPENTVALRSGLNTLNRMAVATGQAYPGNEMAMRIVTVAYKLLRGPSSRDVGMAVLAALAACKETEHAGPSGAAREIVDVIVFATQHAIGANLDQTDAVFNVVRMLDREYFRSDDQLRLVLSLTLANRYSSQLRSAFICKHIPDNPEIIYDAKDDAPFTVASLFQEFDRPNVGVVNSDHWVPRLLRDIFDHI